MKVKKTASGISGFEQTIDGKVVNVFDRDEIIYFVNITLMMTWVLVYQQWTY